MLGRSAGLDEAKLGALGEDPLPVGVYEPEEAAIVRYAQVSTRNDAVDDELYGELRAHFDERQVMEICFTVGLSNLINRFHRTFLTEVDPVTREAVADACPLFLPPPPGA